MATYTATISWERDGAPFADLRYSRAHRRPRVGGGALGRIVNEQRAGPVTYFLWHGFPTRGPGTPGRRPVLGLMRPSSCAEFG